MSENRDPIKFSLEFEPITPVDAAKKAFWAAMGLPDQTRPQVELWYRDFLPTEKQVKADRAKALEEKPNAQISITWIDYGLQRSIYRHLWTK